MRQDGFNKKRQSRAELLNFAKRWLQREFEIEAGSLEPEAKMASPGA